MIPKHGLRRMEIISLLTCINSMIVISLPACIRTYDSDFIVCLYSAKDNQLYNCQKTLILPKKKGMMGDKTMKRQKKKKRSLGEEKDGQTEFNFVD